MLDVNKYVSKPLKPLQVIPFQINMLYFSLYLSCLLDSLVAEDKTSLNFNTPAVCIGNFERNCTTFLAVAHSSSLGRLYFGKESFSFPFLTDK